MCLILEVMCGFPKESQLNCLDSSHHLLVYGRLLQGVCVLTAVVRAFHHFSHLCDDPLVQLTQTGSIIDHFRCLLKLMVLDK